MANAIALNPAEDPLSESGKDEGHLHVEQLDKIADDAPYKFIVSRTGDGDVALGLFDNPDQVHEAIDPQTEKSLMRRVDWMILPYIAVCYAFFYIDKTTLSYAAIFGIETDLHLKGTQYSWLSAAFYFGFLFFAIPTNLLLQRFPVGKYLGINIFVWGILLMCQAACKDFASLTVLRVLGGAAEACADPAFLIITSMWYTRREQPVKIGLWYTANGIGIALGGLLGFGIGNIKGKLTSWKYEFIIIGALCCAWGIVMFLFLPDSPIAVKNFTMDQKRIIVERLRDNQTGVENKHVKGYQILEAFTDYKTYFQFMIALMQAIVNGGISNFGTLIIKGFGFSVLDTTLMQIPYGVFIAISILVCVYLNHYILPPNNRCFLLMAFLLPNIAGAFGIKFVPAHAKVGRLICYYLTGPINAAFVVLLSLQTANTAGHTKKVVNSAILFLGYCVGNIAGPFFYKTDQAPSYPLGIWSMIFCHLLELVIVFVMRMLLKWENDRRDRAQHLVEGDETAALKRQHEIDACAFGDLTDRENPNFRYIY